MRRLTEKAFKEADHVARLLGDMKTGIYEVKTMGGVDEKTRLETLMRFRSQAEALLVQLGDRIGEAIYSINNEEKGGQDGQ